ncbi:MAG: hypothetical protein ACE14S_05365 [Candidatus Bathyarchaeia archaeon]
MKAPEVNVDLRINNYTVPLGSSLEGSLAISSREDFDSTEVRLEIQCTEVATVVRYEYDPAIRRSVLREKQESATIYSVKPVLSGASHFSVGENRNYPLNVQIPAAGRPSYMGVDRRVTWTINAVVAVDGRPDATSHLAELQVIQPMPQGVVGAQPVIKEVVREVVKIPCRYCGTLFDQMQTNCPNCGAKRTA